MWLIVTAASAAIATIVGTVVSRVLNKRLPAVPESAPQKVVLINPIVPGDKVEIASEMDPVRVLSLVVPDDIGKSLITIQADGASPRNIARSEVLRKV